MKNIIKRYWTSQEDDQLRNYVELHRNNWKFISDFIPSRNATQCAQRWKKIKSKSDLRNRKWTPDEDEQLLKLIQIFHFKWALIAQHLTSRSSIQIRERYINHLDPTLSRQQWTPQEDKKLWELYKKFGTKWVKISLYFKGKSHNMIKNRFYSHVRNKYEGSSKNKLQPEEQQIFQQQQQSMPLQQSFQQQLFSRISFNSQQTSMYGSIIGTYRDTIQPFQYQNSMEPFNNFMNIFNSPSIPVKMEI